MVLLIETKYVLACKIVRMECILVESVYYLYVSQQRKIKLRKEILVNGIKLMSASENLTPEQYTDSMHVYNSQAENWMTFPQVNA